MLQRSLFLPLVIAEMQILALNVYNFGILLEKSHERLYDKEKKEGIIMKKLMNILRGKFSVVKLMNVCALALAAYTFNVRCFYFHHQPEVPEDAKRFRKF